MILTTNLFFFYTTYVFIICIFQIILTKHQIRMPIDITYIGILTFILGSFISFIHPRQYHFIFLEKEYIFKGWQRFFTIDIIHIFIFFYALYTYNKQQSRTTFISTFCLTMLYFFIVSIQNVYKIKLKPFVCLFIIVTSLYIAFMIL